MKVLMFDSKGVLVLVLEVDFSAVYQKVDQTQLDLDDEIGWNYKLDKLEQD